MYRAEWEDVVPSKWGQTVELLSGGREEDLLKLLEKEALKTVAKIWRNI